MTERSRKATDQAIAATNRVGELAHSIARQLDHSDGIPVRALSEDDSLVTTVEDLIAKSRTRTGDRKLP
jgi:hypothetical protein